MILMIFVSNKIYEILKLSIYSLLEKFDITFPHAQCNSNDKCNILTWVTFMKFQSSKKELVPL